MIQLKASRQAAEISGTSIDNPKRLTKSLGIMAPGRNQCCAVLSNGLGPTDMLPVDTRVLPPSGSVLMVVTPEHRAQAQSLLGDSCGDRVKLEPTGFQIAGATYDGPAKAVLLSCHRAGVPGSLVTVLYAIQPAAAAKVARLLFFYGWHSVVIFNDGAVAQRDVWQVPQTIKEVRLNAQQ